MSFAPSFSIPQPCHVSWAAMPLTEAGRYCASCATEVVDFTRLSEAELLAFLARQGGRPVCANALATQLAPLPVGRWRRWVLAGLSWLGWRSATAQAASAATPVPTPPPAAAVPAPVAGGQPQAQRPPVIIRGVVLDAGTGPWGMPVRVSINDTQYGTLTDGEGRFELVMAPGWEPVRAGVLKLRFSGNPFVFKPQEILVQLRTDGSPIELTIHMESVETRNNRMGSIRMAPPPVAPPKG